MKLDNEKLETKMAEQGLLWKDLCKRAGIHEAPFRKVRQGITTPRPSTLGKVAKALGCNITDIIKEGE